VSDFRFSFADKVRDQITKFRGVVTGRSAYITGCNQYLVQPEVKEDGDYVQGRWFDEDRLEKIGAKPVDVKGEKPGGPRDNPAPSK